MHEDIDLRFVCLRGGAFPNGLRANGDRNDTDVLSFGVSGVVAEA